MRGARTAWRIVARKNSASIARRHRSSRPARWICDCGLQAATRDRLAGGGLDEHGLAARRLAVHAFHRAGKDPGMAALERLVAARLEVQRLHVRSLTSSRPRMRRVVDLGQRLEVEVRVDLRGGDAGVAEHLLHRAQVLRGLQHVAREGMAQHVRVHRRRPAPGASPRRAGAPAPCRRRCACRARRRRARAPRGAASSARALSQSRSASRARAPTGTVRVFAPLPVTVTSPCLRSSRPSSASSAIEFRQAQAGGIEQFEHAPGRAAPRALSAAGASSSCCACSTESALGRWRGDFGARTPCTGLAA